MLLFSDGMDSYSAAADFSKKWDRVGANWQYSATGGVNGGGSVYATTTDELFRDLGKAAATSTGRIYASFWMKASAAPAATQDILRFYNPFQQSGQLAALYVQTNGGLGAFFQNGYNAQLTATNVCNNTWRHIEIDFLLTTASTAGAIKLYVDGTLVANATGITGNNISFWPYQIVSLRGINQTLFVDDLIVWDSQASDGYNTSPNGITYIDTIRPTGVGSSAALTPTGAAANWDAVNDTASDADTSYVTGTTGSDLYAYGDMASTPTAILGVVVNSAARADSAGTAIIRNKTQSGASTQNGPNETLAGLNYRLLQNVFQTNPATSAAWTKTEVGDAEFGVEIV